MKTKLCGCWLVSGLALALPWLNGCAQSADSAPAEGATNLAPAVVLEATNAPTVAITTNFPTLPEPTDVKPVVPDPEAAQSKPLPAGMLASPSFTEVVRMANAGVDVQVMRSFITNSAGTFNLGADQIIYLKDLGLPGDLVSTMIEHDQAIASGTFQVTASTVPPRPMSLGTAPATATGTPPLSTATVQPSVWQPEAADTNANPYAPAPSSSGPPPPEGQTAQSAPPAPQPTTVINNNYFQETLSPYGNWVNVEGYGNVWQPTVTVINTSWRPYMDGGRWLYTDAGWYWNSDYAWGCTFQYGRWFNTPRHGWCWWPNTVWAPAWVTWRSSPAHCGWAPLPPFSGWTSGVGFTWFGSSVSVGFGFNFGCNYYNWVPWNGVCSAAPYRYRVHGDHMRGVYNQTTVINNVIVGNNNTIINRGVDVDRVGHLSGRPVPRGTIREVPDGGGDGIRPDRVHRDGGNVVIERPRNSGMREASPAARLAATERPPQSLGGQPSRGNPDDAARPVTARGGSPRQAAPGLATTPARPSAAAATTMPEGDPARGSTARSTPARGGDMQTVRGPSPALREASARPTAPVASAGTDRGRIAPLPTPVPGTARGDTVVGRPNSATPSARANPSTAAIPRPLASAPQAVATSPAPRNSAPSQAVAPRPTYTAPTVVPRPTAPVARPPGVPLAAPSARPNYTQPNAQPNYTRPSAPNAAVARPSYTAPPASPLRAPSALPSAPNIAVARPSYTAPPAVPMRAPSSVPSGPSVAAARPSYSAPPAAPMRAPSSVPSGPSVAAARPSYTAPPAPAMRAPSSMPSGPAPAAPRPASPSPSGGGGGSRSTRDSNAR
jgi:hypothetical protein